MNVIAHLSACFLCRTLRRKPTFYLPDRGISRVGATCQIRFLWAPNWGDSRVDHSRRTSQKTAAETAPLSHESWKCTPSFFASPNVLLYASSLNHKSLKIKKM
ncbi:hypothetical protein [Spirosoma profusum]|uniref:hypothetical protein n=1 Tax=Spirosoma profusum TaxID=2771354 RepID=UPI0016891FBC|nr:hypothetical protein [Spirosoma profusum]